MLKTKNRISIVAGFSLLGLVAIGTATMACSVVVDFDETQCRSDSDCRDRGGGFENAICVEGYCEAKPECEDDKDCDGDACVANVCVDRWACVDEQSSSSTDEMVTIVTHVSVLFSETELVGAPFKLCSATDPECDNPSQLLSTDDNGNLTFTVSADFHGYLEAEIDGIFKQLDFLPQPLHPGIQIAPILLQPVMAAEGLAAAIGTAPDPDRGHILFNATSCLGAAPGLRLHASRVDDKCVSFYVSDRVPVADLDATVEDGDGGYLNFPVGNATLEVRTAKTDEPLVTFSFVVRKDTITTLNFTPRSSENTGQLGYEQ